MSQQFTRTANYQLDLFQIDLFATPQETNKEAPKKATQEVLTFEPAKPTLKDIYFYRAEGLITETGEKVFVSIEDLNKWIVVEAAKKEAEGGDSCDKCDFRLTWTDGNDYEGCFLLYRSGYKHHNASIQSHIKLHLRLAVERKQLEKSVVDEYITTYIDTL